MKLKDITKEELETMNYDDIAEIILNEEKAKMKINVLFKKICDALELSDAEYEAKIADFFELLTTDKSEEITEEEEEDIFYDSENEDDMPDNDLEDLVVIDVDDEEANS